MARAIRSKRATAPGPTSGALPCLFHWKTQELHPAPPRREREGLRTQLLRFPMAEKREGAGIRSWRRSRSGRAPRPTSCVFPCLFPWEAQACGDGYIWIAWGPFLRFPMGSVREIRPSPCRVAPFLIFLRVPGKSQAQPISQAQHKHSTSTAQAQPQAARRQTDV